MSFEPASHTNRLGKETSPYLLQHQHNPVDWYPWGEEAFARAREDNKPIFLSVGYSTCYWCHVMERECFESEAIARLMNEHFVCIKVDREERPDVDQLYMTATQILTRQGGWPMSVWLTPDLKPFYAGTYFPPQDAYNRPGFPSLLSALAEAWRERRSEIERHGDALLDAIRTSSEVKTDPTARLDANSIRSLIETSLAEYEPRFGGFGDAPKFPRQTLLLLLLDAFVLHADDLALQTQIRTALTHTLDAMANGGIRDHLGGGFHRYSTDEKWLVPHFEIMLYDQAMLAAIYARAAARFENQRYAVIARGICDFVLREMRNADGAFFTAFDAEVDGREGQNYLWTAQQILEVLGPAEGARFSTLYGVDRGPNFADPHHSNGVPEANILYLAGDVAEESDPAVVAMREKLRSVRALRKQPALDTKIITSWNALMIAGLAAAARELNEPRYRDAAEQAADYLLRKHVENDQLVHSSREERTQPGEAFLDDYAAMCGALLEIYVTTRDVRWQQEARRLSEIMLDRFGGSSGPLFFTASGQRDILVRQQVASDSPLPSGNALAAKALFELGSVARARSIIEGFIPSVLRYPHSMSAMIRSALMVEYPALDVRIDTGPGATLPSSNEVVTLSARRVSNRKIEITVRVADGYHLYDTNIDPSLGLHSTRLLLSPALAAGVDSVTYPAAAPLDFNYGPPVRGFTGWFAIEVLFRDPLDAEQITLSLSFQACDDRMCLRPTVLSVKA